MKSLYGTHKIFAVMENGGKKMLKRNEEGKLHFDNFGFELLIDGLFDKCKNMHELEWLEGQIIETVEYAKENFEEELEVENASTD